MNKQDELDAQYNKSFLEHIEDLRKTIIYSFAFLTAGVIIAFPLARYVFRILVQPIAWAGLDPDEFVQVITVGGGFGMAMRIAVWGGLIISFPFVTFVIARFVAPGLFKRERSAVLRGLLAALILFLCGVALCYFFVIDKAITVMLAMDRWMGIKCTFFESGDYASFVLKLMFGFGLSFEVPVVLVLLGSLGIITSAQLRKSRDYAIIIILIVAAILTPPEVFTQIIMALPMIILYEVCIWIVYLKERRNGETPPQA
jgi:sec-independent protein translocase protein TatC